MERTRQRIRKRGTSLWLFKLVVSASESHSFSTVVDVELQVTEINTHWSWMAIEETKLILLRAKETTKICTSSMPVYRAFYSTRIIKSLASSVDGLKVQGDCEAIFSLGKALFILWVESSRGFCFRRIFCLVMWWKERATFNYWEKLIMCLVFIYFCVFP